MCGQGPSVPIMTITLTVKHGVLPGCAASPVTFDGGGVGVVSAQPCHHGGCNLMCQRLQPYVPDAATLCARGCNPVCSSLQPCVPKAAILRAKRLQLWVQEAATLCARACNPMCQRLQPYVSQVSLLVVGMVTPNSMQFVTREAARIDGLASAAGDALFHSSSTAAAAATGTGTAAATTAATATATAVAGVTAGWYQQTSTDLGDLWDDNRVRLQSLGYLPLTLLVDGETGNYDGATWRLGQGWLVVQPSMEAGLFAHIPTAELINTAVLSGRTVEREVGVSISKTHISYSHPPNQCLSECISARLCSVLSVGVA